MQIQQAIKALKQGHVVAIPTETVYGLAADATNEIAVKQIFNLKNRPGDNPLIVHVASKDDIEQYATIHSPLEHILIDHFMPGPFTILLQKTKKISATVTAGSNLVAIRIPNHPIALNILQQSGLALAAPSANISGSPSPTTAQMVYQNFGDSVDIVDGGSSVVGIESTVIQVKDEKILIHRPGFITPEDIISLVGNDIMVSYSNTENNISPGIKYKHYAPKAHIHLLHPGDPLPPNSLHTGILVTDERLQNNQYTIKKYDYHIYYWGSHTNLLTCAQNLYSCYYQADHDHVMNLYVESLPESNGIAYAIMNRVKKSIT